MEALVINDENFKFDIEDEIPTVQEGDYVFKMVDEAGSFDDVVMEDDSGSDQDEELHEERKKWFKPMVEEIKFKRPLKFFTRHPDQSLGDILSWGYLEDLKVYAIEKDFGVQYFEFVKYLKTLPWWDVEELVKTKNIQQCLWGPEANANILEWKPQYPKRIIKIDLVTCEKDITLHVKRPRCMKNMPLKEIEQDFYKEFKGWIYDPMTCQAVIALQDKNGAWRHI
ncbi:hypothetical protein Hanom_Chr11g01042821 [Helianthus anomalus]